MCVCVCVCVYETNIYKISFVGFLNQKVWFSMMGFMCFVVGLCVRAGVVKDQFQPWLTIKMYCICVCFLLYNKIIL